MGGEQLLDLGFGEVVLAALVPIGNLEGAQRSSQTHFTPEATV
jgi:hypothetical protein